MRWTSRRRGRMRTEVGWTQFRRVCVCYCTVGGELDSIVEAVMIAAAAVISSPIFLLCLSSLHTHSRETHGGKSLLPPTTRVVPIFRQAGKRHKQERATGRIADDHSRRPRAPPRRPGGARLPLVARRDGLVGPISRGSPLPTHRGARQRAVITAKCAALGGTPACLSTLEENVYVMEYFENIRPPLAIRGHAIMPRYSSLCRPTSRSTPTGRHSGARGGATGAPSARGSGTGSSSPTRRM